VTGYFQPQPKFVFIRSYVTQIVVSDQAPGILFVGTKITTLIDPTTGYRIEYNLRANWLPWSSNRYTLDYVVESCFWFGTYAGPPNVQDYGVAYLMHPTNFKMSIQIFNPYLRTDERILAIAPANAPYWLDGTEN